MRPLPFIGGGQRERRCFSCIVNLLFNLSKLSSKMKENQTTQSSHPADFPNAYKEIGGVYYKLDEKQMPIDVRGFMGCERTDRKAMLPLLELLAKQREKLGGCISDIDTEKCFSRAYDLLYYATSLSEILESTEREEIAGRKVVIVRLHRDDAAECIASLQSCAKSAADELTYLKDEIDYLKRLVAAQKGGSL